MTEIENSKRLLLQATYTTVISSKEEKSGNPKPLPKRPFDKLNFVKAIAPTPEEVVAYVRNTVSQIINGQKRVDDSA